MQTEWTCQGGCKWDLKNPPSSSTPKLSNQQRRHPDDALAHGVIWSVAAFIYSQVSDCDCSGHTAELVEP